MSLQNPSSSRTRAILALLLAGLGWGTTGLFVRVLGGFGFSIYELLAVRLAVTGVIILPVLGFDLWRTRRRIEPLPTLGLGASMVFYYLGAITAFRHLQLVVAALIIGSSPLIAWVMPLILERRKPNPVEMKRGLGVAIGITGLALLIYSKPAGLPVSHESNPWIGYLGAFTAALLTVVNARFLNRKGTLARRPFEITSATVVVGLLVSPFLISNAAQTFDLVIQHPWLSLGFGIFATAIPGLAIAYASVRLPPQATSTVSIQLQVWSGVLAWIILNESMSLAQILAAILVVAGSWICAAKMEKTPRANHDEFRR